MDHGRNLGLPLGAVNALAIVYFAILVAAPLLLQPIGLRRRSSLRLRTCASVVPAFAWWLSEVAFRSGSHGLAEAVYLNLSLPNLLHVQILLLAIVIGEIGGRALLSTGPRAWTRGTVLALFATVAFFASDGFTAERYYFGFQRTWRALFAAEDAWSPASLPGPLSGAVAAAGRNPGNRPNIVVILSDDHRHDFTSHAGHPFVETPSLDRLAAEGVRFTNAFVTSSLCSPSRASFLTGMQPRRHGVRNNFMPWDDRNQTFFEHLKRAGYRTAFIGKWHMPGPLPELRGVDQFVTFTLQGGQGIYEDCPLVVNGVPEPSRKRYIAEELTDRAIAFIEAEAAGPFVLYLSHKNVHADWVPDPREAGRHARSPVPVPDGNHSFFAMTRGQYAHLTPFRIERVVRRYAEAVESMDREIGRLLERLDALGLTRDTLVVYTSDNGHLFGEQGRFDKRWALDPSIRVPFLLRHPARQARRGGEVDRMVLNLDLAPTLLATAGLPVPATMEGRSVLPLVNESTAAWRDAFHYVYDFEPPFPAPGVEAIRTDRFKYVVPQGKAPELFDLERDPMERDDLLARGEAADVAHALAARLADFRDGAH